MSINTANQSEGVIVFMNEWILIYEEGVNVTFSPDNAVPAMKGSKTGRIYLTTHRVIFVNKNQKDALRSFSMPFHCLRELELKQPVFGANYIEGKTLAEIQGGWTGRAKFTLSFKKGGAIDFGRALKGAIEKTHRAAYVPQPCGLPQMESRGPPLYEAPPPQYFEATQYGRQDYGFINYDAFPDRAPQSSIYMVPQPPPYPGLADPPNFVPMPQPQPVYQPQPQQQPYPANGYQPQQQYQQSNPPSYTQATNEASAPPMPDLPSKKDN